MILFEEALRLVESSAIRLPAIKVPLNEACGHVLAADVFSDMEMPPFDKAAVDGFACRRADLGLFLTVTETIAAGKWPEMDVKEEECARIMTGAPVPQGADCVFMVEDSETAIDGRVRFTASRTSNNIAFKSEDIREGDKVLDKNTLLKPQHIAILASVGQHNPEVIRKPVVGIISTGDELVEPDIIPGPSQIRNSNAWQLIAQVQSAGAIALYAGIAADTPESTREIIESVMNQSDIIILTGGVSMGEFDFVPAVLFENGIEILFKSIAVQPGRPTVFGRRQDTYFFGLPGNPVSAFVQFELLVRPLIHLLQGSDYSPSGFNLPLGKEIKRKKAVRKSFIPVNIRNGKVFPVDYHGSAHIHSYVHADGIVAVEMGQSIIEEGTIIHVRSI
ncbi:MAG: molybdopterin molybdotransferase MoeA [Bacteroidales bacterium]|nr:molybdopterin molybdotransferase MoeA [Bacteroidales bacterium]